MTPTNTRDRPPRLRFRTRLALAVAVLVALIAALLAWAAYDFTSGVIERRFADELDLGAARLETLITSRGVAIRDRLDRLERELSLRRTPLLEKLLRAEDPIPAEVADAAAGMLDRSGLDTLEIVSRKGVVISSGRWIERVGTRDAGLTALPEGKAVWVAARNPGGERTTLVSRHRVSVGQLAVDLVGGSWVADELVSGADGIREAIVLETSAGIAAASAPLTKENTPSRAGSTRFSGRGGARWDATAVDLEGADGNVHGRLWMAFDRSDVDADLAALRLILSGLVGLAVVVGGVGGVAVARRATKPVDETINAIEAIAAGEADYTFPWTTRDRLDELPQAFSRLHRSLDEQQRRRAAAERVAAWREVARRVAHEVKNPLVPIRITVQNLIKARRQAPELFDALFDEGSGAILEEVDQLQRIVTEFGEFARLPEPKPAATDLDRLVDDIVALYSNERGIAVERVRRGVPSEVMCDAGLLSRAIKNLVANAVDAMRQGGGSLTVETGRGSDHVYVAVRDTGPGFDDKVAARMFEPYLTTKSTGTGLGMAIADRIVSEHDGLITARNLPEGGAEVVVKLRMTGAQEAP